MLFKTSGFRSKLALCAASVALLANLAATPAAAEPKHKPWIQGGGSRPAGGTVGQERRRVNRGSEPRQQPAAAAPRYVAPPGQTGKHASSRAAQRAAPPAYVAPTGKPPKHGGERASRRSAPPVYVPPTGQPPQRGRDHASRRTAPPPYVAPPSHGERGRQGKRERHQEAPRQYSYGGKHYDRGDGGRYDGDRHRHTSGYPRHRHNYTYNHYPYRYWYSGARSYYNYYYYPYYYPYAAAYPVTWSIYVPYHIHTNATVNWHNHNDGPVYCQGSTYTGGSTYTAAGSHQVGGTLVGGVVGAAIGSQFGGGKGQLVAVGVGALLGALIGNDVGRSMDDRDRMYAVGATQQALEVSPACTTITWNNPGTGNHGAITPTYTYEASPGLYCREFQQQVVIGGQVQDAYGTACRQPDGSWEIVAEQP